MQYRPHLDGLRALAALTVLFFHARVPWFTGGYIGVDLFFVLSGYLITLTFSENPNLKQFYIRRARRLAPPLYLMLLVYVLVYPNLTEAPHLQHAGLAALYVSDYSKAFWDAPTVLVHTWTLSVEEHFYLVWPVILMYLNPSARQLIIAYVAATVFRWAWFDAHEAYYKFDTRTSGLILGCFLAKVRVPTFPSWPALIALCTAVYYLPNWHTERWALDLGVMFAEVLSAAAIIGSAPKWLTWKAIRYTGKISYGIYLWHFPALKVIERYFSHWAITSSLTLISSFCFAAISYHTVESYFRKQKHREPKVHNNIDTLKLPVKPHRTE